MMRSLSTSAFGQPSETTPIFGEISFFSGTEASDMRGFIRSLRGFCKFLLPRRNIPWFPVEMMNQSFICNALLNPLPHGRGAQGNGLKTATMPAFVSYEPRIKG